MERCPKCGVASEGMVLHDPHDAVPSPSEKHSETPRTDALERETGVVSGITQYRNLWRDFARQLERELVQLQRTHESAMKEWHHAEGRLRELRSARAAIIEECAKVCEDMQIAKDATVPDGKWRTLGDTEIDGRQFAAAIRGLDGSNQMEGKS